MATETPQDTERRAGPQGRLEALVGQIDYPMIPTEINGEWYVKTRAALYVLRHSGKPVWALVGNL